MGRPFQVEIAESQERLEKAIKQARTASSKERLQMLYWLKSGQVSSRQQLASLLGRNQATISRWLKKYQELGLKSLLEVKSAPGKAGIVRGLALERLKQKLLEAPGFRSYGQIQQWIQTELGLTIAYKTVYQLVRYELGAKLKVPRPQSLKQPPESIPHFQKKFL
ncbi:helix-turn-helix domain-containing protein [Chlorogloea sp. CCALA 695]|uniref:helix-turn-helix domain-containing protein n=1 Tax=Chlorogloea sp. CCALA 695 TaxID=2107693 RepID=UPI0018EB2D18|nr:helix-turn-helix domain-containing protein [Chlorogloea sp. CCALA 695]